MEKACNGKYIRGCSVSGYIYVRSGIKVNINIDKGTFLEKAYSETNL